MNSVFVYRPVLAWVIALFAMTGVAPAATGIALVALLRAASLLRDGPTLVATACAAVAGACGGLAGIGWSRGFDAADAGLPQTGLAAATAPLGAVGLLLTVITLVVVLLPDGGDGAGERVGTVTSGVLSPTLGHPIAMAYVAPHLAAVGTALAVDVRGTAVPGEVVALPFYRRAKES